MEPLEYLMSLNGKFLRYGIKSPDTELYDFGFGTAETLEPDTDACTHYLHILCRFKLIWKNDEGHVEIYDEDSPSQKFQSEIRPLTGRKVQRVALSDKNDLWLDFGVCHIVFATFEDGEESWRFFTCNKDEPHLVASDLGFEFT